MTLKELKTELEKVKIPLAYLVFKKGKEPDLPYFVYYVDNSDNEKADGVVFEKDINIIVELYTEKKDTAMEEKLEKVLTDCGIFFNESDEIYLETEDMFEVIYEFSI